MQRTTYAPLIALVLLSGCATKQYSQGFEVGRDYYNSLDGRGKKTFQAGADYATNDLLQREYAAERASMRYPAKGYQSQSTDTGVIHKVVAVPVPEHTDTDGVKHDAAYKYVELSTVQ